MALYIAFLCLFTAPVDVFLLENALPYVSLNVRALQTMYHVYFAALALFFFVGAPLAYNYAKQTEIAHLTLKFSAQSRFYAAAKRTGCFLLALISTGSDRYLSFHPIRGLASVPVVGLLMEDHNIDENKTTFEELLHENAMETQATTQTRETILQRYAVEQQMSGADQERLSQLKTREKLLEERRDVLNANLRKFASIGKLSCWKIPIGVILIILSLMIVTSILITSIDKMAHSGFEQGFLLNSPEFFNPMDLLLVLASRVFPLDYVVFTVLFVYLFAISLIVLKRHGLQFLCFRLGRLQPRLTSAATMTMLSLVLMQLAVIGLFALLTMAPQYATFGHQTFSDAAGQVVPCTLQEAAKAAAAGGSPTHCRLTQMARFYNGLAVELPMFGAAFFLGQLIFATAFVPWIAHAYCMAKKLADPIDSTHQPLLSDYQD
ncbi:uncharacterized protein PHALS_09914 [Plasmopara halstedii]|uniref:Lysosomal cobalamin transporter n=1 Tax=Plasmopara halstedii TaxID=4781 RepID=A0A0P1AGS9_PLAHL|nr:uncharacterized protein PHALS_09914 [Plasmopara halstedii]CEG39677.1 hypothetical protein PHALS_09914 [Plasmopara halstedii]|eukprot:XP_024576046.1 hypothetical protein PHALS_09914 [Plasmopara halstedii]